MSKKILIFVSKTGGGHVSLGEALRDQLPGHTVTLLDPQPAWIHWHYRMVSRHALWLWAAEFKTVDTPPRAALAHRLALPLFQRWVAPVLLAHPPDLIITTYPFFTYEVAETLRRLRLRIPLVLQMSDANGVHHTWLTEKSGAANLAPTRETHAQALANGFAPARLHLTGWPVRAQFYQQTPETRAAVQQELNLAPDRFTVFLQGGGEGAAGFSQTLATVLAVPNVQVILATGTNAALLQRAQGVPHLRALPFTPQIARYMAAAEVVMGKAGPNMLLETVTLGRPFIATTYIPGQEEVNLQFIEKHGLGWVALDGLAQTTLLKQLAARAPLWVERQTTVNAYRAWNTAAVAQIPALLAGVLERHYSGL